MKHTLLCFFVVVNTFAFAQSGVSINTTKAPPDPSAMLDIANPNRGILIPRVALKNILDKETIPDPASSLLVFNLTNNTELITGYYFNSGTSNNPIWSRLSVDGEISAWSLSGNNIADLAYMGSNNDENVVFKRFGEEAFRISPGGSILATGNTTTGKVPIKGAGTKLFWSPAKAAFRAGNISNANPTYWDEDSVGKYSFAVGQDTKAKGDYSFASGKINRASGLYSTALGGLGNQAKGDYSVAMGYANTSTGNYSLSMGFNNHAEGDKSVAIGEQAYSKKTYSIALGYSAKALETNSVAIGSNAIAQAPYSTAIGDNTNALGLHSTSMGYETNAQGAYSTAIGNTTTATGESAMSMGNNTTAKGDRSTAMGHFTTANAYASTTLGLYNDNGDANVDGTVSSATNRIFQLGNGDANLRKNALTILKNGNIGTGGVTNPSAQLHMRSSVDNSWESFIRMENTATNKSGYIVFNGSDMKFKITNTDGFAGYNFYNASDISVFKIDSDGRVITKGDGIIHGALTVDENVLMKKDLTVQGTFNNSDIRLKENITSLNNILEKINNIQPITYYFKDKKRFSPKHQIGFSAQEIEKTFPELVKKDENGFLSLNYAQMSAVAIQAIKEQQKIIDDQKKAIHNFENKLSTLSDQLRSEKNENELIKKRLEAIEILLKSK